MRFAIPVVLLLLLPSTAVTVRESEWTPLSNWVEPAEPFRITGNLYYVGSADLTAFLFTTDEGHDPHLGAAVRTQQRLDLRSYDEPLGSPSPPRRWRDHRAQGHIPAQPSGRRTSPPPAPPWSPGAASHLDHGHLGNRGDLLEERLGQYIDPRCVS